MIDITASSRYASKLAAESLVGPPLLVGVGLVPGLTSVLARMLVAGEANASAVTISCLIGLGESRRLSQMNPVRQQVSVLGWASWGPPQCSFRNRSSRASRSSDASVRLRRPASLDSRSSEPRE